MGTVPGVSGSFGFSSIHRLGFHLNSMLGHGAMVLAVLVLFFSSSRQRKFGGFFSCIWLFWFCVLGVFVVVV